MTVNGTVQQPTCGLNNGCVNAWVSGGASPYSYLWSPAPSNGQGTPSACGLGPGVWTLTVTDANSEVAAADFNLVNQPNLSGVNDVLTYVYEPGLAAHHACPGQQEASICVLASMLNGTPPYTVTVNGAGPLGFDMNSGNPYFGYFYPFEYVNVVVTDANGCAGYGGMGIDGINTEPFAANNIDPSCGGLPNGSVDLLVGASGPFGPNLIILDSGGGMVYNGDPWTDPLHLIGLAAGTYTAYRIYSSQYFQNPCMYDDQFTIPDLGVDCGTVSGTLYIDNDQDCVLDPLEVPVPYRVLEILPGPEYAITDADGHYTRNVPNGAYTIVPTGTDLYPVCPLVQPVPFTIADDAAVIDIADSSTVPLDLQVYAFASVARPGFAQTIWGQARNLSAQLSGSVTVTVTFDMLMSLDNAYPTPTSVNGNVVSWELPTLAAYQDFDFTLQVQVPPNVNLIGTPFAHTILVTQVLPEQDLANNSTEVLGLITGSYDPNDKTARTSTGWSDAAYYLDQDQWIDYTIRFQNTGTDTAFNVVIMDTLPAELDMSTFVQAIASHPFSLAFKDERVVEWRFENILLPDSGTNEPDSHGLVAFRIKPAGGLLPGAVIRNSGNIYFDFNEPVVTAPISLVLEQSTSVTEERKDHMGLWPNPAHTSISITSSSTMPPLVLDLSGRQIAVPIERRSGGFLLDVRGLPDGIYAVRTDAGRARFVKQ